MGAGGGGGGEGRVLDGALDDVFTHPAVIWGSKRQSKYPICPVLPAASHSGRVKWMSPLTDFTRRATGQTLGRGSHFLLWDSVTPAATPTPRLGQG